MVIVAKMKKIGILGGTFDPIHMGHLIIAENAFEQLSLDEVLIMPSGKPPHKSDKNVLSIDKRSAMIKLSVAGNSHLNYSSFEVDRAGYVYTVDTLRLLHDKYESIEIYFIVGEDSIDTFCNWRLPEEIVKLAQIVVAVRSDSEDIDSKIEDFDERFNCKALLLRTPYIGISSSEIRDRIKNGMTIKYMVADDVEKYIYTNGLYR